jgi:hypothetical protein
MVGYANVAAYDTMGGQKSGISPELITLELMIYETDIWLDPNHFFRFGGLP